MKVFHINKLAFKKLKNFVIFLYGLQTMVVISSIVSLFKKSNKDILVYFFAFLPVLITCSAIFVIYSVLRKRLKQNRLILSNDNIKINTYHRLRYEKNSIKISEIKSIKCIDKYSPFFKIFSFDCVNSNINIAIEAYGENKEFIIELGQILKEFSEINTDQELKKIIELL